MVTVEPTPASLLDAQGRVRCGVFDAPCPRVDIADVRLPWRGRTLPRWLSRLRLKQWQHVALVTPEWLLGFAIVDAGYLRTSWCHVLDRRAGEHFEHGRKGPLLDLRTARELFDDRTHVHARGYRIDVHNHLAAGEHRIAIDIAGNRRRPAVRAELSCAHDLQSIAPLVVVLPVGDNRGAYSHKVPLPCAGTLEIDGRSITLDSTQSFALWDVHKAHYPRRMFWNWATGAGRLPDGRALGINLTRNVNRDDDRYNENVVWLDGARHHFGSARFTVPADPARDRWQLGTAGGEIDLTFQPAGERAEALRLGLVESVFQQPYGAFAGRITLPGETLEFADLFGVCEDHHAVW